MAPMHDIVLNQRRADLLDSIEGWHAVHGPARQRYRQYVRNDIAAYRRALARHLEASAQSAREALAADVAAAERQFINAA